MSSKPKRVQLKRTRCWRKPANTVVVSRPSPWGNPFRAGHEAIDAAVAVKMYRDYVLAHGYEEEIREELRGKNLACWCKLGEPCHADVLLEIANALIDQKPKITALAPWAGSKRTLAPQIVQELGPHKKYDEVFCGSAAILMAKPPVAFETINDLHGDLVNLARCLKREATAIDLYERLGRTLMHEELFHEAAERWHARGHIPAPEEPDVDRAEDFMLCSWLGRNGCAGMESYNQGYCVRYTKNGGHSAKRWTSAVESIPPWHRRLREVTILNRDGFELLERLEDSDGCAIYVDPPYLIKGLKYIFDFKTDDPLADHPLVKKYGDHGRLALLLSRFKKTRVVVSYYDHPDLEELYPPSRWRKRCIEVTKALVNQSMRDRTGPTKATEVLLVNSPSGLFDRLEASS